MNKLFLVLFFLINLFADEQVDNFLKEENKKVANYLKHNKFKEEFVSLSNKYTLEKKHRLYSKKGEYDYLYVPKNYYGYIKRKNIKTLKEELVLDINELAKNHKYYKVSSYSVSNSHKFLAFSADITGHGNHILNIYDIENKKLINTKVNDLEKSIVWSKDDSKLFFLSNDKKTYITNTLYSYDIKTKEKKLIYKENNKQFVLSMYKSSNDDYAVLSFNDNDSSFQKIIDLNTKKSLINLQDYKKSLEYYVDIIANDIFIYSNKNGKFAIYKTSFENKNEWKLLYEASNNYEIEKWHIFKNHIALQENKGSLKKLIVLNHKGKLLFKEALNKDANSAWLSNNSYANTSKVIIRTQSITKTPSFISFDMNSGKSSLINKDKYKNFNESDYVTKEIFINNNGVKVPVSLAYNKTKITDKSPVYIYVYGAYNFHMKRYFMKKVLPLLDKGFIYAIAHVRGGNYLGSKWEKDGLGINRLNSIEDFLSVAKYLKTYKGVKNRNIIANASSAGGVIVAAALNKQADLFKAVVLKVPYLDVLNTLKQKDLAYKDIEFSQWGNPNKKDELKVIKAYDPMLNIEDKKYPNLLVKISKNDTRVPYTHGLNYVQEIRKNKNNKVLLYTDLYSGHQDNVKNGEFAELLDYTFILEEGLK